MAHHLGAGVGYRFNASGPIVDAVTPLGWAHVLAPFAVHSPLSGFQAARFLGALSWLFAASFLGYDLSRERGTLWPLGLLCVLAPLGAWASAGMETGVVIALVALSSTRKSWGLIAAGLAAALRPELVVYAFVLALGRASSQRLLLPALALSTLPALSVAMIRMVYFGEPYPLAAAAKPADLTPGLFYSAQALLLAGPFWLWPGPGFRRLDRLERGHAVAVVAHLVAVALAGGDWMVLLRLVAPVLPGALRVASLVTVARRWTWQLPTWVCAVAATAYLGVRTGLPGRHLVAQRMALMTATAPLLRDAKVVATLDVGWVGTVHTGTVVDFAGVTNPTVAHLAGGHTTKRIDAALLRLRNVDHVVLLLAPGRTVSTPWESSQFARGVEFRAAFFAAEMGCTVKGTTPLPGTAQLYLVVRCPT